MMPLEFNDLRRANGPRNAGPTRKKAQAKGKAAAKAPASAPAKAAPAKKATPPAGAGDAASRLLGGRPLWQEMLPGQQPYKSPADALLSMLSGNGTQQAKGAQAPAAKVQAAKEKADAKAQAQAKVATGGKPSGKADAWSTAYVASKLRQKGAGGYQSKHKGDYFLATASMIQSDPEILSAFQKAGFKDLYWATRKFRTSSPYQTLKQITGGVKVDKDTLRSMVKDAAIAFLNNDTGEVLLQKYGDRQTLAKKYGETGDTEWRKNLWKDDAGQNKPAAKAPSKAAPAKGKAEATQRGLTEEEVRKILGTDPMIEGLLNYGNTPAERKALEWEDLSQISD
jgi:hypothetical protein